jgi:hypothetical protein
MIMRIIKVIGAWGCLGAACVLLAFSVGTGLVLPLTALSIAFSLAPEAA